MMSHAHPTFVPSLTDCPPAYDQLITLIEERVELWWRYRRQVDWHHLIPALQREDVGALADRLNVNNDAIRREVLALAAGEDEDGRGR